MDLVTTVKKDEIVVGGSINIGMQELVSVGVARMERKFRRKVKELTKEVEEVDRLIKKYDDEIMETSELKIPTKIKEANEVLTKTFKSLELKHVVASLNIEVDISNEKNFFQLLVKTETSYRDSSIQLVSDSIEFSKTQKEAKDNLEKNQKKKDELTRGIVEIRRKLSDVNVLERQMKAHVVESQLHATEEGKKLLDSALEKLDESLDILG